METSLCKKILNKKTFAKRELQIYCPQNPEYVQPNNEQTHTVPLVTSQGNEILFPQYSKNGYHLIYRAGMIHMNKSEKSAN